MTDKRIDPLRLAGKKSKGKRPWFLENGDNERLLNMMLAMTQEMAVMRGRMDTIERLLERGEPVTQESIDKFQPSKSEQEERGYWKQAFIARVFRILQQDREAAQIADEMTSSEVSQILGRK